LRIVRATLQCASFSTDPDEVSSVDTASRKRLRQIAHHLHPVIIIGDAGVSDAVIAETDRALADHELIKVKVNAGDRDDRQALGAALTDACRAELVQRIGKVLVLYRHNPEAVESLSNVLRAGGIRVSR
jgi:RNA-binding protein